MTILRYKAFKKIIFDFFSHNFLAFSILNNKPSRSRRSASRVKEKCVRGQGEVRWGSRRSASAEWVVFSWRTSPWPQCTFPWPRRTSPWTLTHLSLTPDTLLLDLKGFFSELKNLKIGKEKFKNIFETLYILKIFLRFSG